LFKSAVLFEKQTIDIKRLHMPTAVSSSSRSILLLSVLTNVVAGSWYRYFDVFPDGKQTTTSGARSASVTMSCRRDGIFSWMAIVKTFPRLHDSRKAQRIRRLHKSRSDGHLTVIASNNNLFGIPPAAVNSVRMSRISYVLKSVKASSYDLALGNSDDADTSILMM
jgi:hypothetical protein